ncbi:hypothetical protein AMTRI_Chr06g170510 [Amborella trichopoda]
MKWDLASASQRSQKKGSWLPPPIHKTKTKKKLKIHCTLQVFVDLPSLSVTCRVATILAQVLRNLGEYYYTISLPSLSCFRARRLQSPGNSGESVLELIRFPNTAESEPDSFIIRKMHCSVEV